MSDAVTVVITRQIRPGREDEFEKLIRDWVPTALTFPGYLGVHMLRPAPGGREYGAVIRFRSAADWEAFRDWPVYAEFSAKIAGLIEGETKVDTVSGMEIWFTPPGSPPPVPSWKMAIVTWIGVNSLTYMLALTLMPHLADWPVWGQLAFANAIVVGGLTWVVMPLLVRIFRGWLFSK